LELAIEQESAGSAISARCLICFGVAPAPISGITTRRFRRLRQWLSRLINQEDRGGENDAHNEKCGIGGSNLLVEVSFQRKQLLYAL
jgi:hypothetical protein